MRAISTVLFESGGNRPHGGLQQGSNRVPTGFLQGSNKRILSVIITGWHAKVAELADALALGASGVTLESSSLSFRTTLQCY